MVTRGKGRWWVVRGVKYMVTDDLTRWSPHDATCRCCITDMCTWNLYDVVNQFHPNIFNKKYKNPKDGEGIVSLVKRTRWVTVFSCFGLQAIRSALRPLWPMGLTLTITSVTWALHSTWLVKTRSYPVPRSFWNQVKQKAK